MVNEKRQDLIDRKTLAEELSSLSMMVTGLRAGKGVLKEFMEEYRKSVLRIVDEQATVDAVEVPCRCCDCYYLLNSINSFGIYFFCGHRNGLKNLHNTEKDFCPYGKVRHEDGK